MFSSSRDPLRDVTDKACCLMDEPNEVSLGPKGWVRYEDNARGVSLCRYFWPAEGARAVVVVVHGHGGHVCFEFLKCGESGSMQAYAGSFVEAANSRKLSVCGVDLQGHGRSNSLNNVRCYVDRFQDYVDDVLQLATYLSETSDLEWFSGLPVILLGVSLGGCIAVQAIHQRGDLFRGVALVAPMLSLEKVSKQGLNPYLRPIASFLSQVTPYLCAAKLPKNEKFPEIQAAFDNDPLCFHLKTRARVATEYLRATEKTVKEMPSMTFPFLIMHSPDDEMTDYEGSKQLMAQSKSVDKTMKDATDMWHFLLKEPGHERIVGEVLQWVLQHT